MGNLNLSDGNKCPICGELNCSIWANGINDPFYNYECPKCGDLFIPNPNKAVYTHDEIESRFNLNHLQSYLFYHKTDLRPVICSKAYFDKYITDDFVKVRNITPEMVESLYPKSFAEKNDCILLYFYKNSSYIGEHNYYNYRQLVEIFILDNKDKGETGELIDSPIFSQIQYYLDYFYSEGLLSKIESLTKRIIPVWDSNIVIQLAPKGLARVDYLLKNHIDNKNAFIAMKFGEETKELREKIKEGLKGYNIRIMDEIEHNHQIVPEMLYEIKNSRFVVAELSHHNNGAYYEAGYALGLGKEVIHICNKKELKSGLHFDVAQVNTIFYDSIDEIPEKLRKRIEATIN